MREGVGVRRGSVVRSGSWRTLASGVLGPLLVFVGGGLGALGRYALAAWLDGHGPLRRAVGPHFPVGTLAVNLSGCLLIGAVAGVLLAHEAESPARAGPRLLLVVGILGGFTTFSSFVLEAVNLIEQGRVWHAVGYVLTSNVLGVLAAVGGGWVAAVVAGGVVGAR